MHRSPPSAKTGTLSLVGTPIGNLGDITLRAIETLKAADRIYAEDTRRTRALLSHLGIGGKKLLPLHAHSTERVVETAVEILQEGNSVVLVTDAGMPSVSDPGSELVRAAEAAHVPVTVVPGPSAVTTAVALSGMVDSGFTFLGFLPRKGGRRRDALAAIAASRLPVVLFEAPTRLQATLADLAAACGARHAVVCRELTKRFEEAVRGTLAELAERDTWQGEATVVIGPGEGKEEPEIDDDELDEMIRERLLRGGSVKGVVDALSREGRRPRSLKKRDLYARVQHLADEVQADGLGADGPPETDEMFEEDEGDPPL